MQSNRATFHILLLGDHGIVFKINAGLKEGIDPTLLAFNQFLTELDEKGIKDIILAYDSITLIYDIMELDTDPFLFAHTIVEKFESTVKEHQSIQTSLIEIPVCYDPSLGIDLAQVAHSSNLSIEAFIQLHSEKVYTVYCLGFLPGFAYMGDVAKSIQVPRHASPRAKVLAGSVGIAGKQTGIYPLTSPGGWQIIGRTPLKIFDPNRAALTLFKAGDQVKFNPIPLELFHQLNAHEDVD